MSFKNKAIESFISKYPDINNFFIKKVSETRILSDIILNYLPILIKWNFNLLKKKNNCMYLFNTIMYGRNIKDCWKCFKEHHKRKHFELLSFDEFKNNIQIIDDSIYKESYNSNVVLSDLIIVPLVHLNTPNILPEIEMKIIHHKYIDSIKNNSDLYIHLDNYNSYYQSCRELLYNIDTGLIENLCHKTIVKTLDNKDKYIILKNIKIERICRINNLSNKYKIIKRKLFMVSTKNGWYRETCNEYAWNLKIKFIDKKNIEE